MKKVKAIKNFSCNGVKKKAGEFLNKEEMQKMGEKHYKSHLDKDLIMVVSEDKKEEKKQDKKESKKENKE